MLIFFLGILCFSSSEKENNNESLFNLSIGSLRSLIDPIPIDYLSVFGANSAKALHTQTFSEYLIGETIYSTLFQINTESSEQCKIANSLSLTKQQKEKLINIIDSKYQLFFKHPYYQVVSSKTVNGQHLSGVDVGTIKNGKHYISNSFKFTIQKNEGKIAFIEAEVFHSSDNLKCLEESPANQIAIEDSQDLNIYYSYQFSEYKEKDISSSSRNDQFSSESNQMTTVKSLKNLPIISSAIISIVLFLYIYKTVYKESKHADNDLDEYDGCEWKLIHADVCRSPKSPEKLSELFGWGIQLFVSILVVIFILAFESKSKDVFQNLNEILDLFIKFFILSSLIGGFFTGKMFKTIGSREWKTVVLKSSIILSIILLVPRLMISFFSPPQSTLNFNLMKLLIPVAVNFVLHSIGCLIGLRVSGFELSQKVNILPRQIPPHSALLNSGPLGILSGLFISIFMLTNYYLLLEYCWGDKALNEPLHLFDLLTSIISVIILSIDFGIIMVFTQLKKEDYKWWWTAFWAGGMNGVIFFFFSILDYFELFSTRHLSHFIFYSLVNMPVFIIISIISGAMSFIGCFFFVQFIYNSLKME